MTQDTQPAGNAEASSSPAAAATAPPAATDVERRDEMATRIVDRFSVWSGAAGLIPLPFVDVATIAGVQLQMLRRLSALYDVPFSKNRGKAIVASLAGAILPASSTMGVASALKSVPALGTAVSVSVMPFAAAGSTWVIGKVFIQHFQSGGTLLDFSPPDYREFIKAQKEKWQAKSADAAAQPAPAAGDGPTAAPTGL